MKNYISDCDIGEKLYILNRRNISEGFIEVEIKNISSYKMGDIDCYCYIFDIPDIGKYILEVYYDDKVKIFNVRDKEKRFKYFITSYDKEILIDFLKKDFKAAIKKTEYEISDLNFKLNTLTNSINKFNESLNELNELWKKL